MRNIKNSSIESPKEFIANHPLMYVSTEAILKLIEARDRQYNDALLALAVQWKKDAPASSGGFVEGLKRLLIEFT